MSLQENLQTYCARAADKLSPHLLKVRGISNVLSIEDLKGRIVSWRDAFVAKFPEHHIYVRTNGQTRGFVLTTRRQLQAVAGAGGVGLWAVVSTLGMIGEGVYASASNAKVQKTKLAYEKLIASHDAKMIAAVDKVTQSQTGRLRETLQQVGVNPDALKKAPLDGEGGPLIAPNGKEDGPMADRPETFEEHVERAARDILDMRRLGEASSTLPLSRPTTSTGESSGYGVRTDPFTGRPAFHPGLDFPAPVMTPVFATAPGVVIFTGGRMGYGNTIEIDHGGGFKTRFAHLAAFSVKVGQHITNHERIGAVGSTGRSTGAHLHYEVWRDGRPQDPERFLKAGEHVQQAG